MGSLQLVPGERLGCFALGMGINDALALLRKNFVPWRPEVEVVFSQIRPLEKEILLRVEELGLLLRFEPKSQRLRMLDVLDPQKLSMQYEGVPVKDTFLELYKMFGPTYPGSFEDDLGVYVLRYQGISFLFDLPKEFQAQYAESNELPIELPNGVSPEAVRVMLYSGSGERNPVLVETPKLPGIEETAKWPWNNLPLTTFGPWYLEDVTIKISPGSGAPSTLHFLGRHVTLEMGCSVQDIVAQLGQPSKVFFKHDNRMRIHSDRSTPVAPVSQRLQFPRPNGRRDPTLMPVPVVQPVGDRDPHNCFQPTDYFYNFFDCGFDLLIDGSKHTLKKFIAHTNFPGHSEFSHYNKCEFRVVFHRIKPGADNEEQATTQKGSLKGAPNTVIVAPSMRWSDVETLLGPCGRPMIHDSGVVANPFGATYLYAYQGCVFEVMRSGHVAGVTVF